MKDTVIKEIMQSMLPFLDNAQLLQLQGGLNDRLAGRKVVAVQGIETVAVRFSNEELLLVFLSAKKVEGCSDRTVRYYRLTLQKALEQLKKHLTHIFSKQDDNPALFVSLQRPYNCLQISGVEIRLRELGRKLGIHKVHPHKFRRTLATRAIES